MLADRWMFQPRASKRALVRRYWPCSPGRRPQRPFQSEVGRSAVRRDEGASRSVRLRGVLRRSRSRLRRRCDRDRSADRFLPQALRPFLTRRRRLTLNHPFDQRSGQSTSRRSVRSDRPVRGSTGRSQDLPTRRPERVRQRRATVEASDHRQWATRRVSQQAICAHSLSSSWRCTDASLASTPLMNGADLAVEYWFASATASETAAVTGTSGR